MDISIFLAQAFGIYFVLAGLAMLIRPKAVEELVKTFSVPQTIFLSGFISLLLGIPLVLIHNIWDGSWRVIITVLVWLALFKGVVRIFLPETVIAWGQGFYNNSGLLKFTLWVVVALGLYLINISFNF